MKKVLFATTALVASAGIAAADVVLSGTAEIGIAGNEGRLVDSNDVDAEFWSDLDVRFTLSGETDNGLTFGATIDLDEVGDDANEFVNNDANDGTASVGGDAIDAAPRGRNAVEEQAVFISGVYGTLTMGDTDGAFDWGMQEVDIGGAIADDHTVHAGFNGNSGLDGRFDGQIARYEYAFGDFAAAVSVELDDQDNDLDDDNVDLDGDDDSGDPILGLGLRYTTNFQGVGIGFGFGYQHTSDLGQITGDLEDADAIGDLSEDDLIALIARRGDNLPALGEGQRFVFLTRGGNDEADLFGVSADLDFGNGFRGILNYSKLDADNDVEHVGIGLGYTVGAWTVGANYGNYDREGDRQIIRIADVNGLVDGDDVDVIDIEDGDSSGWGVAVNYDLGGGAVVQAGYGKSQFDAVELNDRSTYSVGLALAF